MTVSLNQTIANTCWIKIATLFYTPFERRERLLAAAIRSSNADNFPVAKPAAFSKSTTEGILFDHVRSARIRRLSQLHVFAGSTLQQNVAKKDSQDEDSQNKQNQLLLVLRCHLNRPWFILSKQDSKGCSVARIRSKQCWNRTASELVATLGSKMMNDDSGLMHSRDPNSDIDTIRSTDLKLSTNQFRNNKLANLMEVKYFSQHWVKVCRQCQFWKLYRNISKIISEVWDALQERMIYVTLRSFLNVRAHFSQFSKPGKEAQLGCKTFKYWSNQSGCV